MVNGILLQAATEAGFDILITADRNIVHQQNMRSRRIGLIVLSTNHWAALRRHAQRIFTAVEALDPAGYAEVECGMTPKRRHLRQPPGR